jgi:hypothetical protein
MRERMGLSALLWLRDLRAVNVHELSEVNFA